MSSSIETGVILAPIIVLPAAAVLGAGWIAWRAGKLVLDTNRAVDRQIAENKRQLQDAQRQRKQAALDEHRRLVEQCRQTLNELAADALTESGLSLREAEQFRAELADICEEPLPADAEQIESLNLKGLHRLSRIRSSRQKRNALPSVAYGEDVPVVDLMRDLKTAVLSAEIHETDGDNVEAADPFALERAKLQVRRSDISARIFSALEYVADFAENNALSQANRALFHSCFDGMDTRISSLYAPGISNSRLKKELTSLEELLQQFDMLLPDLEKEKLRFDTLYPIYCQAAAGLGEPVYERRHFSDASAVEAELNRLKERADRAAYCAEVYQKLGYSAYLSYAWDQELKALGYSVHTRDSITELAGHRPQRARLDGEKLPFYQWDEKSMTQLYSVSPQCDLQLIVHADGSTTMQTIAKQDDKTKIVESQRQHCEKMSLLRRKLQENWFIQFNSREAASPDEIMTAQQWRTSPGNKWRKAKTAELEQPGYRTNDRQDTDKPREKTL